MLQLVWHKVDLKWNIEQNLFWITFHQYWETFGVKAPAISTWFLFRVFIWISWKNKMHFLFNPLYPHITSQCKKQIQMIENYMYWCIDDICYDKIFLHQEFVSGTFSCYLLQTPLKRGKCISPFILWPIILVSVVQKEAFRPLSITYHYTRTMPFFFLM